MRKSIILFFPVILLFSYGLQLENIQYHPNIIHPGDDVDLWVKVYNNNYDDEVKNIVVSIEPYYPFELKQVNPVRGVYKISHLNPGEADIAYFKLHVNENALSGEYKIKIKVSYDLVHKTEIYHQEFSKIFYLPIYGVAEFKINVNKNYISPGQTESIVFTIKNVGNGKAKNLNIYLEGNKEINVLGSSIYYTNLLDSGSQKSFEVNIYCIPEIDDGIYPIVSKISWIGEDGEEYNETIPINIRVVKKIYNNQPFIYLDGVNVKNGLVEITIGVANRGNSKIKHCVLFLNVDNITYIKYIGDLNEDDYDTSIFNIKKFGNYTIKVRLNYFDNYHNQYNITKTFNINVNEPKKESNNPLLVIVGIVIVLLVILYIFKRKKKSEEKIFDEEKF